jgi:phosphatidylcholine synthase
MNDRTERPDGNRSTPLGIVAVWAVHLLTAFGAVCGMLALVAAAQGRTRLALVWMAAALVIDSADGTLARRLRARARVAVIDGGLLDNVVDYFNYAVVPAFLMYSTGLLPNAAELAGPSAVCLASAFQFARIDAKTPDRFFRGFPSYWNLVVFHMLLLGLPQEVNLTAVAVLCVLSFVPIDYVDPSRTVPFRRLTLLLSALWATALAALLYLFPDPPRALVLLSLLYLPYYFGLSLFLTVRRRSHA